MKTSTKYLALIIGVILIGAAFAAGYFLSQTTASQPPQKNVTVLDSANRYVTVSYPVEKIVVLWNNPTEELKALGAIDRIVGIDTETKAQVDQGLYPELATTPVVGSSEEPNYEEIGKLKPDVVIMLSSYPPLPDEVQQQLEPFGIPVVALDFYRTDVFYREVSTLGYMLGLQDKADAYMQFFNSTMSMISSRISEIPDSQKPSVYFEGAGEYYTYGGAGYGSGIPGMIRDGGGIDLYPEVSSYYFQVDPETVAQRNPDFIFKGQGGGYFFANDTAFKTVHDEVASRPELANTNAVKNGNVYTMSFDIAGGARKMFGPMYIAKILYPDTFADFDPNAVLKEYLQTYMGRNWQGVYLYPGI